MKILVDADTKADTGRVVSRPRAAMRSIHCLLDLMYAKAPYTVVQRAMHIHPTVADSSTRNPGRSRSTAGIDASYGRRQEPSGDYAHASSPPFSEIIIVGALYQSPFPLTLTLPRHRHGRASVLGLDGRNDQGVCKIRGSLFVATSFMASTRKQSWPSDPQVHLNRGRPADIELGQSPLTVTFNRKLMAIKSREEEQREPGKMDTTNPAAIRWVIQRVNRTGTGEPPV